LAGIPNLIEVVSLDSMLCPPIVTEFNDEDWAHIVNEDFRLNYFYDLDYLIRRAGLGPRRNVLGLYRNPHSHIDIAPAPGEITFIGYDLIEEMTQISALTNCGGCPGTFSNEELNERGLISSFARAREVQTLLPLNNPQEPHAHCEMYAVWRLGEGHAWSAPLCVTSAARRGVA
jgi:hypothetical protein